VKGFVLAASLLQAHAADAPYQAALSLLGAGKAAAAETKAREALALSQRFTPEEEIEHRPERGLLFEEMIQEARKSYRDRRSRYFIALGDALAAQEKWPHARKSYRRALGIEASPGLWYKMAGHPDLELPERVGLLLEAYLAPGADRARLETELLGTGSFRTRNALKASLDRGRFGKLQESFPELELLDRAFSDFQAATDAGTLIPSQLFRAGTTLLVYAPVDGCGRCSEELDGLTHPVLEARKRKRLIEVAAFVRERDLPDARRIVRLLGMTVGVGRKEGLPPALDFLEQGEIRFVAHGGLTQIRLPMSETIGAFEIQRAAEAILAFFEEPGLPTEKEPEDASLPLLTLEKGSADRKTLLDWIETTRKLEAGPAPVEDLYADIARLSQRLVSESGDRGETFEILSELSRLRGAIAAKTRVMAALSDRVGEHLLERAQRFDPAVRRTPTGEEGALHVAVSGGREGVPRRVFLQRSFESGSGLRHFDFVLDAENLGPVFVAPSEGEPLGVESVPAGGVFHFGCPEPDRETCRGVKLIAPNGDLLGVAAPGAVVAGRAVAIRSALVDAVTSREAGPALYRGFDEASETALERGLRLFDHADYAGAAKAFEEAVKEIDDVAPYDASDLLYNRGRALQEEGKRREALDIFRCLADVSYQVLVDEKARLIESGR
jgi:tetratricopeptide (TPR) repeat protein